MLYLPLPLDGSEPLECCEVDPGDPGHGGDPRPHDVAAAVAGDLAQQLREVLLRVEQSTLVLHIDGLQHGLVSQGLEHLLVELSVLGEQLEYAVLQTHRGRGLDELAVRLRVEFTAHILRWKKKLKLANIFNV